MFRHHPSSIVEDKNGIPLPYILGRLHKNGLLQEESTEFIKENVTIWTHSQIRKGALIGKNTIIGKDVYIDTGVKIGDNCKIQNGAQIYNGVTIENGVFIGPGVIFTNDMYPRAINPDGTIKKGDDWEIKKTLVKKGASIGANATIVCGVIINEWAMIGSASVVTKNVDKYSCVVGNPARHIYFTEKNGKKRLLY